VNWSTSLLALVPLELVTVTPTVPLPAGAVATIDVALLMVNGRRRTPNCTALSADEVVACDVHRRAAITAVWRD
jgi:predicted thioesterase